jgi:alpha-beta hydrolase superfamily lysophospholipase
MTIREGSNHYEGLGGLRIFYRTWEPEPVRGTVVVVHGFNQHSGHYQHVANHFAQKGFRVIALDLRGYGQSEGQRAYVDGFADFIHDLHVLIEAVSAHERPILIGHSMGGLISFLYALSHPDRIKCLVLASPWFGTQTVVAPIMKVLVPALSVLYPNYQTKLKISGTSRATKNQEIAAAVRADPLVANVATARWYRDALQTQKRVFDLAPTLQAPILVLQAGQELIVSAPATRALFERLTAPTKTYKEYPDKYHEIFNDPGHEQVFDEIIDWLETQHLA